MDIINLIKLHYDKFSKSERKVYEYIINHPENVETYTITKIASMSNTSTSAVLRFCQTLGFQGYKDFRFEMIKYLHEHIDQSHVTELFQKSVSEYIKVLNQFSTMDRSVIDQLINILKQKGSIYLIGLYYSALPCRFLKGGLQDLNIMSYAGYDYVESGHLLNCLEDDDTLICFSVSGSKNYFNQFASSILNNMPEKSYLITLNPNAQIKDYFKHVIVLPGYQLSKQSVIDCQSIMMIFVEMLLNELHYHKS